MDRRRYEYALVLTETLEGIADDVVHVLSTVRRKAALHPLLGPPLLAFDAAVRHLFETTVDPVLGHWREETRVHEDQMAAEARQLAPGFVDRVDALGRSLRNEDRHDEPASRGTDPSRVPPHSASSPVPRHRR